MVDITNYSWGETKPTNIGEVGNCGESCYPPNLATLIGDIAINQGN